MSGTLSMTRVGLRAANVVLSCSQLSSAMVRQSNDWARPANMQQYDLGGIVESGFDYREKDASAVRAMTMQCDKCA